MIHLTTKTDDAFARQPLPEDSALWNLPNVITPRIAGTTSQKSRLLPIFQDILRRFIAGHRCETWSIKSSTIVAKAFFLQAAFVDTNIRKSRSLYY